MNCEAVRLQLGAAPRSLPPEATAHIAGCTECRRLLDEALAFETRLTRALATLPPVVAGRAPTAASPSHATRPKLRSPAFGWALAASVLVATLGLLLWTGRESQALATEVIGHLAEEPASWSQTQRLPQSAIDLVFAKTRLRIDADAVNVVYSNSCWFRERYVPHLVVTTPKGPVTVMVLEEERVSSPIELRESGYHGKLVPMRDGAIAVIGRSDGVVTDEVVQRVLQALHAAGRKSAG